jgi:hypothetical protein
MAAAKRNGSILVADCGTAATKAALLDCVDGRYRLIARGEARTTSDYPHFHVGVGVRHAVDQIGRVTGRDFIDVRGDIIAPEMSGRQGTDAFAVSSSASRPLQVVVGGLVRDLSIASAERAVARTYSRVKAVLGEDGAGSYNEEQRVRHIRDAAPDAICIAGGVEGGASSPVLQLVETAVVACSLMEEGSRPSLLYAGNSQLRRRVVSLVEGRTELRVADNVRPSLTEEELEGAQAELEDLSRRRRLVDVPGIDVVASWSRLPVVPTARAFSRMIEYLWHLTESPRGVLGIDIGASSTTVAAVFGGRLSLTVCTEGGSVFSGERLLRREGASALTRWLPQPMSEGEVRAALITIALHPTSIPQVQQELWLQQALAREVGRAAVQKALPSWRPGSARPYRKLLPLFDTIVMSGGVLSHASRAGQAALMVLDVLEPIGISTLVLDKYGLLPLLGAAGEINPLAAVDVMDSGGMENLGTVIAPVGRGRRGEVMVRLRVTYEDGSSFSAEARRGELEVVPLPPGQQAVLELRPGRQVDIGLGGPGRGGKRRVTGGMLGLIIDARGRPVRMAEDPEARQRQVARWMIDLGG